MRSLHVVNMRRNRARMRIGVVALLVSTFVFLPMGLPGTSDRTAAQSCFPGITCPNGAFNVAALVASIDVTWNGGHHWRVKFNLQSGVGTTGSCGDGSAVLTQITDAFSAACGSGGTATDDAFALDVNVGTCNGGSFTVGFKVFGYLSGTAGRVHGNVTITKSNFTTVGQTIYNYAPVPGC